MRIISLTIILILVGLNTYSGHAYSETSYSKPFRIVKISNNPRKQIKRIKPLADYLAQNLHAFDYTHGEVVVVKTRQSATELLKSNQAELVASTAATASALQANGSSEILALRWKNGLPSYHSVLVARKGSGINTMMNLAGKRIAFEDASSTTSFTLPAGTLIQQGFETQQLATPRSTLESASAVGYVFGYNEKTLATWISKGLVDAVAFSDIDWFASNRIPEVQKASMTIIWQSDPIPRALILANSLLDIALKRAIGSLLMSMHEDQAAGHALATFNNTSKFEPPTNSLHKALSQVGQLVDLIETNTP